MKVIISSTGTSVYSEIRNSSESEWENQISASFRELEKGKTEEEFLVLVSAETHSLHRIGIEKEDHLVFLTSDTPEGKFCAKHIEKLSQKYFHCSTEIIPLEGLQVDDAELFRRTGIRNLFEKLRQLSEVHWETEILINATGGFKSVVPYLSLYGLMKGIPCSYVFERSSTLLRLPAVPVNVDYERLEPLREAIDRLLEEEIMTKSEFRKLLPEDSNSIREELNAIAEEDGDEVLPTAFCQLLNEKRNSSFLNVLLSKSAFDSLNRSSGDARKQFLHILSKIGDPLSRKAKTHAPNSHGMLFYKAGNTSERIAFTVEKETVRVHEVMLHAEYDQKRDDLQPNAYSSKEFERYNPGNYESPPERENDVIEELQQNLDQEIRKSKKIRDKFNAQEQLLKITEEKLKRSENSYDKLNKELKKTRDLLSETEKQILPTEPMKETDLPWWKKLFGIHK